MTTDELLGRVQQENEDLRAEVARLRAELEEMRRMMVSRECAEDNHRERLLGVLFGGGR